MAVQLYSDLVCFPFFLNMDELQLQSVVSAGYACTVGDDHNFMI